MTKPTDTGNPDLSLASGAEDPMTPDQAESLRRLAKEAYDFEAFRPNLTRSEAARRIAVLQAKLKLQSEPPHTA